MSASKTPPGLDAIAVSVADATRLTGISRSELYRLMGAGRVRAIKHGVRTLILTDSLRALIESAPIAAIRTAS